MNQTAVTTRSDLEKLGMDALDKQRAGEIAVSRQAGGVSFSSAVEVMEFAKLMAVGGESIAPHLRNNPGTCLRVVFQAIEWGVSPYAVADQSYVVGGRMGYMAQLIHAIVLARAPLAKALETEYSGEGPTRRIKVIGTFADGELREYESPMFKDIKVKNSPLWTGDPDQQFHYFGTRSWARRWVPHVLFGIYTPDELKAGMGVEQVDDNVVVPLKERLKGPAEGAEGHSHGHAERELSSIVPDSKVEIIPAGEETPKTTTTKGSTTSKKKNSPKPISQRQTPTKVSNLPKKVVDNAADKAEDAGRATTLTNPANVASKSAASAAANRAQAASDAKKAAAAKADPPMTAESCKTPEQYAIYFRAFLDRQTTDNDIEARWDGERDIRDALEVPLKVRKDLEKEMNAVVERLRG